MQSNLENKVTVRLSQDDMNRLSEAADKAGLPVSTFSRNVLMNALDLQNVLTTLNRHEKYLAEIFRQQVSTVHLMHLKQEPEAALKASRETLAEFVAGLDSEG